MTDSNRPDLRLVDSSLVPEDVEDDGPLVELRTPRKLDASFWYDVNDFAALPTIREYLVRGWLVAHGITALLARRGTGKSTVALDLGCHIAKDMDWLGIPTMKGWKVIYICGEDDEGMILNVRAWGQHNDRGLPDRDRFMVAKGVIKMTDRDQLKLRLDDMREWANGARCLVILDTWARATSGYSSNTQEEMDLAYENAEAVAAALQGPMIACFHPPKNGKLTIRGSAVQEDASSGIWFLEEVKPSGRIKLTVERIKGTGKRNSAFLALEPVDLTGTDEHGEILTDEHGDPLQGLIPRLLNLGQDESVGQDKLDDARTTTRTAAYAKLLLSIFLKDRDRDTRVITMGNEIAGISMTEGKDTVDIPQAKQARFNIKKYFTEPVQAKDNDSGITYLISITGGSENQSPVINFTRVMEAEEAGLDAT